MKFYNLKFPAGGKASFLLALAGLLVLGVACRQGVARGETAQAAAADDRNKASPLLAVEPAQTRQLLEAAMEQVNYTKSYDPAYVKLAYPMGDVPLTTGVCSDVIIRAFRKVGVDLQKEVHEDMKRNFAAYPQKWGLRRPDANIDHRRVPNLMTFFKRRGKAVPLTGNPADYRPGDIVAWNLGNGLTHIGLMTNRLTDDGARLQVVHNIGSGARVEDILFAWKIIGHYRYF